jgi:hypothetical protein
LERKRCSSWCEICTCKNIRNKILHGSKSATPDEARLLLNTVEHFLAYFEIDVEAARSGDLESVPLRFENLDDCLPLLIRKIWKFPETEATRSWAVKESTVLRGDLTHASEQPGLGISLFTTELALNIFGGAAIPKVCNCVDWGVSQIMARPPFFIQQANLEAVDGNIVYKPDFRHTVALAILMSRSGTYQNLRNEYLNTILNQILPDGSWPSIPNDEKSSLPATVYAVEFLMISQKKGEGVTPNLLDAIRHGQEFIARSTIDGGWTAGIFPGKPWEQVWTTAYLFPRLTSEHLPVFDGWTDTLVKVAEFLLRAAPKAVYENDLLRFRVEARVAAALACALGLSEIPPLLAPPINSWLNLWEHRFFETLRQIPFSECDLATATFSSRALIRNKNLSEIAHQVLKLD